MEVFFTLLVGLCLALWVGLLLRALHVERRRRRRELGLRPEVVLNEDHPRNGLPHREKDWRNAEGIEWSNPRYYGRYGRPR